MMYGWGIQGGGHLQFAEADEGGVLGEARAVRYEVVEASAGDERGGFAGFL